MMTAALKFTSRFAEAWRRRTGEDVRDLSDKCLRDIGFTVHRPRLDSVKPFWMA